MGFFRKKTVEVTDHGKGKCPYTIKIGNRHKGDDGIYCGRGTPLGNPFMGGNRSECCNKYYLWLLEQIYSSNESVIDMINEIDRVGKKKGEVTLLCSCAPKECHTEKIRKYIYDYHNVEYAK